MAARKPAARLTGVYIHLPFCDVKCAYCDFYSIASRHVDDTFWNRYADRLLEDLQWQFALLAEDTPRPVLASIFFGGGTPSKAPAFVFERVIAAVRKIFPRALKTPEVTAEANPESLTDAVLKDWHGAGLNRVSIGMQSRDEQALKYLGRLYNPKAYAQVLAKTRAAGFTNFSADFITGVPGQTAASTLADIEFAMGEGVTHLSLYQLTIEPGTLLKQRISSGRLPPLSDARQVRQMEAAILRLEAAGLRRYEISNFARKGHRCRHNLIYWTQRPYLGLGVAAHAFTGRRRFFHPRSLDKYMAAKNYLEEDTAAAGRDALINLLRLKQKMHPERILSLFPAPQRALADAELKKAERNGWFENDGRTLAPTHRGLRHTDSLLYALWNIE